MRSFIGLSPFKDESPKDEGEGYFYDCFNNTCKFIYYIVKRDGEYKDMIVNFSVEALKCVLHGALFKIRKSDDHTEDIKVSVPSSQLMFDVFQAGLCFMHNLLHEALIEHMDYRYNLSLKILNKFSSALLSHFILKTMLTASQWLIFPMFFILCFVGLLESTDHLLQGFFAGWLMAIHIIKTYRSTNIKVHNFWFSMFELIFNILTIYTSDAFNKDFFLGYSRITVFIIVIKALSGIVGLMVLKYNDNIVKAYSTSIATFVAAIVSTVLFDFQQSIIRLMCFLVLLFLAISHIRWCS